MKRRKVLIADDNEDFCEILSEYIDSQEDFKVVKIAHDGAEALRYLKSHVVDVVILDIIMPRLDGLGVLEQIKSFKRGDRPNIFMLSAVGQDKVTQRAMEMGADYYLVKPFDHKILTDRIRQILRTPAPLSLEDTSPGFDIQSKVSDVLKDFGIPNHVSGYQFVRAAIIMCFEDVSYLNNITKRLYPDVADMFEEATPSRVERSIRNAIELAWTGRKQSDRTFKRTLHCFNLSSKRPTNGKFIASITDRLKLLYSK